MALLHLAINLSLLGLNIKEARMSWLVRTSVSVGACALGKEF